VEPKKNKRRVVKTTSAMIFCPFNNRRKDGKTPETDKESPE
jgi:hypothetical protein